MYYSKDVVDIWRGVLESQAGPVARPAVQGEDFPALQLLLAKVLGDAAADLGEC